MLGGLAAWDACACLFGMQECGARSPPRTETPSNAWNHSQLSDHPPFASPPTQHPGHEKHIHNSVSNQYSLNKQCSASVWERNRHGRFSPTLNMLNNLGAVVGKLVGATNCPVKSLVIQARTNDRLVKWAKLTLPRPH